MIRIHNPTRLSIKMRKFLQNKLWRDKMPQKLEATGSIIHIKKLTDAEFNKELRIKLLEEADEVQAAQSKEELIGELADIYEVIDTICALHGINKEAIQTIQTQKRNERGGFIERKYVTIAEHPEGSYGVEYCLAQAEKYPEIK